MWNKTLDEILSLKKEIPLDRGGIYFLINGDSVVYVGQGKDVDARICFHLSDGEKEFTHYSFIACSSAQRNDLEAHYIFTLRPIYNKNFPENKNYKSIPALKKIFGTNAHPIKKIIRLHSLQSYLDCYDLNRFLKLWETANGR